MNDIRYHIDVTPEEDRLFRDEIPKNVNNVSKYNLFGKPFFIIVTVHIILAAGLTTYASSENSKPTEEHKPIIAAAPVTSSTSANATVQVPPPTPVSKQTKLTEMYTIKQGDTIYSISKKYKLNVDKLLKLNNIKDPNKIVVGQQLKFL